MVPGLVMVNGPEAALIIRYMGRNRTFEGIGRIRNAIRQRHINAALTLRRRASIINFQIRSIHGYGNLDGDRFIKAVHLDCVLIGFLRKLGNGLTHGRL